MSTRTWRVVACAVGVVVAISSAGPALAEAPASPDLDGLPALLEAELTVAEEQALADTTSGDGVPLAAFVNTPDGPEIVTLDAGSQADAAAAVSLLDAQPSVEVANVSTMARPSSSTYEAQLYGTAMIHAELARTGVDNPLSDVVVAVLDTGIFAHPELAAAMVPGQNFTDSPGGTLDTTDRHGHGTHVAGTIAADAGSVMEGVAYGVQVMPVKVLGDDGPGWDSWIADGIIWAADNGADVINMSLGAPGYSAVEESAITYARSKGVTVIAAAGNDNSSALYSPAGLTGVVAVAAVDETRTRASFSNYGPAIDVAAPGVNIVSTNLGDWVTTKSGTSMAAPHVAGVAALVVGAAPGLTPDQVERAIVASTADLGAVGRDDLYGNGLVDAARAVQAANSIEETGAVALAPVVATAPDSPTMLAPRPTSRGITVNWSAPADDGYSDITKYTVRLYEAGTYVWNYDQPGSKRNVGLTNLKNNVEYRFEIAAVNAQGTSPAVTVTATPHAVASNVAVTLAPGNGSVAVTWAPPTDDGGSAVTGYSVLVRQAETDLYTLTAGASDRGLTVTGLTNGLSYVFVVSATNADGPNYGTVVWSTPRTTPGAPTVGSPTPGRMSVVVPWTPPADNGGAAISGYTVRAYVNGVEVDSATAPGTATSLSVTLAEEVPHTFTVSAQNAAGPGPASAHSAAVTPGPPPTPAAAPVMGTPEPGSTTVRVRWTAPANDGGSPVTGYTVTMYRGGVLLTSVDTAATEYLFQGLVNGTEYSFTVAARSAAGTGAAAGVVSTPVGPPGMPVVSTPAPRIGAVALAWTAPDDGGSPITGYTVLVHQGPTLLRTLTTAASDTGLIVTGLTNRTPYTFVVTATNGRGTGPAATMTGTPHTVPIWTCDVVVGGLVNGTAYSFVVQAQNAAGLGPASVRSPLATPHDVAATTGLASVRPGGSSVTAASTGPASVGSALLTPRGEAATPRFVGAYGVTLYTGSTFIRQVTVAASARGVTVSVLTAGVRYTFGTGAMNAVIPVR